MVEGNKAKKETAEEERTKQREKQRIILLRSPSYEHPPTITLLRSPSYDHPPTITLLRSPSYDHPLTITLLSWSCAA